MKWQKQRDFAFGVAKNWKVFTYPIVRHGGRWGGCSLFLNFVNVSVKDVASSFAHKQGPQHQSKRQHPLNSFHDFSPQQIDFRIPEKQFHAT
jgi:hypothetical protein